MSVVATLFWFFVGGGLVWLGAFFLWCVIGKLSCGVVLGAVVPSVIVFGIAGICGSVEITAGIIWGAVTFNFALVGLLYLCFGMRVERTSSLLTLLWVGLGFGACFVAGRHGRLGMCGGWGLLVVGLVAVWKMWTRQKETSTETPTESCLACHRFGWCGRLVLAVMLIGLGAWLMVWRHGVVAAVLKLPDSWCGALVMAPLCGLTFILGLRWRKKWQASTFTVGLMRANVLLVTVGLGLVAVLNGGLPLTQSTLTVTLPWVSGLAVMTTVASYLPQKTARWWGGLVLALYLGYVVSLLG
ncbi:MAG: hypothetical protein J5598_03595 [Clostridia bacterium]|nr:hypothetical protein [Clostridia bacterium]